MNSIKILLRGGDMEETLKVMGEMVMEEERVEKIKTLFRVAGQTVEIQEGDDLLLFFPDGSTLRLKKWFLIVAQAGDDAPTLQELTDAGSDVETVDIGDDVLGDEELEEIEDDDQEDRDYTNDFNTETFSPLPALIDPLGVPDTPTITVDPPQVIVDPTPPTADFFTNGINDRPILDLNSLTGIEDPTEKVSNDRSTNTNYGSSANSSDGNPSRNDLFLSKDPNNGPGGQFNLVENSNSPDDPRLSGSDSNSPLTTGAASAADYDSRNPSFRQVEIKLVDPNDPSFTNKTSFATETDPDSDPSTDNSVFTNFNNAAIGPHQLMGQLPGGLDQELFVLGESIGNLNLIEINRDPMGGGVFLPVGADTVRFSLAGARDSDGNTIPDDPTLVYETAEIKLEAPGVIGGEFERTLIDFSSVNIALLDGTRFEMSESTGGGTQQVRDFYFQVDGSGTPNSGSAPVSTAIQITSGMTPAQVAQAVRTAINDAATNDGAGFSAAIPAGNSNVVRATATTQTALVDSNATSASAGGVAVTTVTQGQDAQPIIRVAIDPIDHSIAISGEGGRPINKDLLELILKNLSLSVEVNNTNGSNFEGELVNPGEVDHPLLDEGTLGRLVQVTVTDTGIADNGDLATPMTSHPVFVGMIAYDRPMLDLDSSDNTSNTRLDFVFSDSDLARLRILSDSVLASEHQLIRDTKGTTVGVNATNDDTFYREIISGEMGTEHSHSENIDANPPSTSTLANAVLTDLDTPIQTLTIQYKVSDSPVDIQSVTHSDAETVTINGIDFARGTDLTVASTMVNSTDFRIAYTVANGFVITLASGATPDHTAANAHADWEALINGIVYSNAADLPIPGDKMLEFQVRDNSTFNDPTEIPASTGLLSDPVEWMIDQKAQVGIDVQNGDFSQAENEGSFTVNVVLNGVVENLPAGNLIFVDLSTVNGVALTPAANPPTGANLGADFQAPLNTISSIQGNPIVITFDPTTGAATVPVTISLIDDSLIEDTETFGIVLSNLRYGPNLGSTTMVSAGADVQLADSDGNLQGSAILTITDSGDQPAVWSITGLSSVAEGADATYTISLAGAFGDQVQSSVTVSLNDNPLATTPQETEDADIESTGSGNQSDLFAILTTIAGGRADLDFNATTGVLTFTAQGDGDTMEDIIIGPDGNANALSTVDDTYIEYDQNPANNEAFQIALSSASANSSIDGANDDVVTTIVDNDGPAVWSLTGSASVTEGNSATYTISLAGEFGIGYTSTIQVLQNDDDGDLTNPTINAADIAASGNNNQSDLYDALATFAATRADLSFNSTTGTLTFTALTDGATMADVTVSLAAVADGQIEVTEDYQVSIANPGPNAVLHGTDTVVSTDIVDDGVTTAEWSITGDASVNEGSAADYKISLSGTWGAGVFTSIIIGLDDKTSVPASYQAIDNDIVNPANANLQDLFSAISAIAGARADLSFNSGTGELTFTSQSDGSNMADIDFSLTATNDAEIELAETYDVNLALPVAPQLAGLDAGNDNVTTTINVDAGDTGEWSIAASSANVAEGGSTNYIISLAGTFGEGNTASVKIDLTDVDTLLDDLGGAATGNEADLYAALTTAAGARADLEFNATTGILTFTSAADGSSMTDLTVSLTAIDDNVIESAEDYNIALSTTATQADGSAQTATSTVNAANDDVTTTIDVDNNDAGEWSLTSAAGTVNEGGSVDFTLALSGAFGNGETATVKIDLTDGSNFLAADLGSNAANETDLYNAISTAVAARSDLTFNAGTGVLTFTAQSEGDTMAALAFSVTAVDDALVEADETFNVALSAQSGNTGINGANDDVDTTISDNNVDTATVTLSATDSDATEGAGNPGQFTVNLGQVNSTGAPITVNYSVGGTATAGTDYTALSGSVVVANGSQTATIDVTGLVDDAATAGLEGPETITVTLTGTSNGQVGVNATPATVTINEVATATITANDPTADESGDPGQFTINLGQVNNTGSAITVNYAIAGNATAGGVDYNTLLGSVMIANGAQTATIDITGTNDDGVLEGPEEVILTLTSTNNAAVGVDGTSATVTIADAAAATVGLTATDATAAEGGGDPGEFTITLSEVSQHDTVVNFTMSGSATEGSDYVALSGSATILAGSLSVAVPVTITDDVDGGPTVETIIMTLDGTDNPNITIDGGNASDSITLNNAAPPIVIDLNGDGFDFIGIDESSAHFNLTGDGSDELVAWAGPDDGFLAFDFDHDGLVTQRSEIAFTDYAPEAETDLQALGLAFDTNHDGFLTNADDDWASFGVWQDRNSDGHSDEGEFSTLDELGITGIALTSDGIGSNPAQGVEVHGQTTVFFANGTTTQAADVSLAAQEILSENGDSIDSLLPETGGQSSGAIATEAVANAGEPAAVPAPAVVDDPAATDAPTALVA